MSVTNNSSFQNYPDPDYNSRLVIYSIFYGERVFLQNTLKARTSGTRSLVPCLATTLEKNKIGCPSFHGFERKKTLLTTYYTATQKDQRCYALTACHGCAARIK